jgi:hypothetical protein
VEGGGGVEGKGSVSETVFGPIDAQFTAFIIAEGHNATSAVIILVNMGTGFVVDIHCYTGPF